jgi:thiamine-monophosphate kinase
VSLGLPTGLSKKDVEEIGKGLNAGAREYDAYIIGGDTSEASDLVISVSLLGIAKKSDVILRSCARMGDVVAVTGPFGRSCAGLKILLGKFKASPRIRKQLTESVLMPRARLKEGLALAQTKTVTAAIDSSDGLAWSLHELGRASNVGFLIDNLPISKEAEDFAKANKLDPLELALYGGEEYELVLTITREFWNKAKEAVERVGGRLMQIGKVTSGKEVLLERYGEERPIEPRGWEHFKSRET